MRFTNKNFPCKHFLFHHVDMYRKGLLGIYNFFTLPHFSLKFEQCHYGQISTRIPSVLTRCLWSSLRKRRFAALSALAIKPCPRNKNIFKVLINVLKLKYIELSLFQYKITFAFFLHIERDVVL